MIQLANRRSFTHSKFHVRVTCTSDCYESPITSPDLPLLDRIWRRLHTALTYHRTWETGLEEVTRVSSSSPLYLQSTPSELARIIPGGRVSVLPIAIGSLKSNHSSAFFRPKFHRTLVR